MLIKRRPPHLYDFENNYRHEHVMNDNKFIYCSSYLVWPPPLWMHSMSLWRILKRSLGLYPSHPLWNVLPIVKLASVPIWEMWRLGRDTIMYPPVQIIPGVVDQRWIGTREAGQWVWHGQLSTSSLPYCRRVCWNCLAWRENCFKHFDKLASYVRKGLHPHSDGL